MLGSSVTKKEAFGGGVNVDVGVTKMIDAGREQLRTAALLCVARSVSRAICPQLLGSSVTKREEFGIDFTVDGEVFGIMSAVRVRLGTAALRCVARHNSRATCPQLLRITVEQPVLSCSGPASPRGKHLVVG